MPEEIIENNRLITEFMGWYNGNYKDFYTLPYFFCSDDSIRDTIPREVHLGEMKFHKSWNWIFPVLEKINSRGCIIEISMCFQTKCRICIIGTKQEKAINIYSELNDIKGVYDCIIQFIKHYNEKMVK